MLHQFADFLPRGEGYWTILPNQLSEAYRIGNLPAGSREITIVTVGRDDEFWQRAYTLPNLEELSLHRPTSEQLDAVSGLRKLRRLRITSARPKDLEFIRGLRALEELVLEYVSGFSDLSPLAGLTHLRALHIENLRRVSDFSGLAGLTSLRYLAINGTLDWLQPIEDLEFLRGTPNLEALRLWQIDLRARYPALLPVLGLERLNSMHVHHRYIPADECALLEVGLGGLERTDYGPFKTVAMRKAPLPSHDIRTRLPEEVILTHHPEVSFDHDGTRLVADPSSLWYEFTGRGAGRAKCGSTRTATRCLEYAEHYEALKRKARNVLAIKASWA